MSTSEMPTRSMSDGRWSSATQPTASGGDRQQREQQREPTDRDASQHELVDAVADRVREHTGQQAQGEERRRRPHRPAPRRTERGQGDGADRQPDRERAEPAAELGDPRPGDDVGGPHRRRGEDEARCRGRCRRSRHRRASRRRRRRARAPPRCARSASSPPPRRSGRGTRSPRPCRDRCGRWRGRRTCSSAPSRRRRSRHRRVVDGSNRGGRRARPQAARAPRRSTRNQATVCGSTSSKTDTAIAAPTYCDTAESTKSASGVAVSKYRVTGPGAATVSQTTLGIGAADLLPQRLEAEPSGQREAGLLGGVLGVLVADRLGGAGRHRHQLSLARALHRDEPERGLVDRVTDREQPVVLVDRGFPASGTSPPAPCPPRSRARPRRPARRSRHGRRRRCRRPG